MNLQTNLLKKGYNPSLSEGSLVTPIFRSSTFCFNTAEEGERSFQIAYGLDTKKENESPCLIYTRVNNPNMEIVEDKLAVLDNADKSLVFSSGMGAISTTCLTFLKPNDIILFNEPVYGGTEYLLLHILPQYNIKCIPFKSGIDKQEFQELITLYQDKVKMIVIETPCNPLTLLTSIKMISQVRNEINRNIIIAVDNTFAGPFYHQPLNLGADLVIYSVTKFIGGHGDLVAGSVSGSENLIQQIKVKRTILGNIAEPDTCWLIQRSLPTLKLRMDAQQKNALELVEYLSTQKHVTNIYYPNHQTNSKQQLEIFREEYKGSGSLISFELNQSKEKIFQFLNSLKIIKLAVSLGSLDTLIQHPSSMTHSDLSIEDKNRLGITDNLIRCSVGIEEIQDLIYDLKQSFLVF